VSRSEADLSSPPTAEVKNTGTIVILLHAVSSWYGA
jgi:hypothetical protein